MTEAERRLLLTVAKLIRRMFKMMCTIPFTFNHVERDVIVEEFDGVIYDVEIEDACRTEEVDCEEKAID